MNIMELLESLENNIEFAKKHSNGAAERILTVYKHTALYLIETDKLNMTDDIERFWDYPRKYTSAAMYRIANHQRKQSGLLPLNYEQACFHRTEVTIEEWKASQNELQRSIS